MQNKLKKILLRATVLKDLKAFFFSSYISDRTV